MKKLIIALCWSFTMVAVSDVPMLQTERCVLRELVQEDGSFIRALAAEPAINQYTAMFAGIDTAEQAAVFIAMLLSYQKDGSAKNWVILAKEDSEPIGFIWLFDYNPSFKKAELGYFLLPAYWGKGIATEVSRAVITYAFDVLGLIRLQATADPRNEASKKVLEKCGMQYEGLLKNYYIVNNEPCDRYMYALCRFV